VDFPIIGEQTYSERAVMGVPLLFLGYLLCYILAVCVLRDGKEVAHPGVPAGNELSRRFFQAAFWSMMGMQVVIMAWSLVPLFDIEFRSGDKKLEGLEIFQIHGGSWRAFGEDGKDQMHSTVWPGFMPYIYCMLVVASVISCVCLPFVKQRRK
jgi:hypothetical protein